MAQLLRVLPGPPKVAGGKAFSEHFTGRRKVLPMYMLAGSYVEKGQELEARRRPVDIFETCRHCYFRFQGSELDERVRGHML